MKKKKNKPLIDIKWVSRITIIAFIISFLMSFTSELVLPSTNTFIGICLVIVFISIGILFDIIGIAVTSADDKSLHSMSAKNVRGAKMSIFLKNNADRVSSFCCDVIGDICGIISGSAGVIIAANLSSYFKIDIFATTLFVTALIASLTIGGKAMGKGIAMKGSNKILHEFAIFLSIFPMRNK